ncbi:MAG: BlaI/MecI/CopY family transcriptional regulator [Actinomycetota bacterium]
MAREVVAGHRLPAAEAEVLRVLLDATETLVITDILDRLPKRRAHTTISTLLSRLGDRGLVERETRGRGHAYRAVGTEQQLMLDALRRVVDGLDDPAAALAAFINELPPTTRRRVTARLRSGGARQ